MGVHTGQMKGRLPAGIGGGRQAASKIDVTFIQWRQPWALCF